MGWLAVSALTVVGCNDDNENRLSGVSKLHEEAQASRQSLTSLASQDNLWAIIRGTNSSKSNVTRPLTLPDFHPADLQVSLAWEVTNPEALNWVDLATGAIVIPSDEDFLWVELGVTLTRDGVSTESSIAVLARP